MKASLLFGALLAMTTAAASAAPTKLTDPQMDKVAAGVIPVDPPPVNGHPWHPGPPPIVNPVPLPLPHPIVGCFGRICA